MFFVAVGCAVFTCRQKILLPIAIFFVYLATTVFPCIKCLLLLAWIVLIVLQFSVTCLLSMCSITCTNNRLMKVKDINGVFCV